LQRYLEVVEIGTVVFYLISSNNTQRSVKDGEDESEGTQEGWGEWRGGSQQN